MATCIKREYYCEANLAFENIDTLCYYNCQKCIPPQNDFNNSHLLFFFFLLSHFWCCSWFFIVLRSRLKRRSSSSQSPRPKKRKKKKSGRRRSRWAETALNFFISFSCWQISRCFIRCCSEITESWPKQMILNCLLTRSERKTERSSCLRCGASDGLEGGNNWQKICSFSGCNKT